MPRGARLFRDRLKEMVIYVPRGSVVPYVGDNRERPRGMHISYLSGMRFVLSLVWTWLWS